MGELRQRLQQMYSDLDCLFQHETWTEIADSVVCSSRLVRDNAGDPLVELRMNLPLHCGVHQAGDILWRRMMETSALIQTPNYFFQVRQDILCYVDIYISLRINNSPTCCHYYYYNNRDDCYRIPATRRAT